MTTTFYSAYDIPQLIAVIIGCSVLITVSIDLWKRKTTAHRLVSACSIILFIYILNSLIIRYVVEGCELKIFRGVINTHKIHVKDILSFHENTDHETAPALSLDRLRIVHTKGSVNISPAKKNKFIEAIKLQYSTECVKNNP